MKKLNALLVLFFLTVSSQNLFITQANSQYTEWYFLNTGDVSLWNRTFSVGDVNQDFSPVCFPLSILGDENNYDHYTGLSNSLPDLIANPEKKARIVVCANLDLFKNDVGFKEKDYLNLPQKDLYYLIGISEQAFCPEGDAKIKDISITDSVKCEKDPGDNLGRIKFCKDSNCKGFAEYKNSTCDFPSNYVSGSTCNNFIKCEGEFDEFTDTVSGNVKTRRAFCLPNNDNTGSVLAVCSNEISFTGQVQVSAVNYSIALQSIRSTDTNDRYYGVCKNLDAYLSNNSLIEVGNNTVSPNPSPNPTPAPSGCSLDEYYGYEILKPNKYNCTEQLKCETNNIYSSQQDGPNIFCIKDPNQTNNTGVKYACLESYLRGSSSTTKEVIDNYPKAQVAINTSYSPANTSLPKILSNNRPCLTFEEYERGESFFRTTNQVTLLNPLGVLRSTISALYAVAGFIFVISMILNGLNYVNSSSDTKKLELAKKGLFNSIAGLLFIIFSGGLIINITKLITI